ncbi:hypothetical protein [Nocardioides sp.]|uniref:hypothetical protein n=1 Tax=Nocardioides sp. TaxID=35761 RepID=UPI002D165961|nr:hypothetical protein [Nocardioides sp.]HXH79519.1 hypothetical protein [Nocardioides sp.]
MATSKQLNPEDVVYRYTGDPAVDFFFGVPARDLTAGEWESNVEPTRKQDVRVSKFYVAVGTRPDRLADAGLPDVIVAPDIPTAPPPDDVDTGGIVPQRASPVLVTDGPPVARTSGTTITPGSKPGKD